MPTSASHIALSVLLLAQCAALASGLAPRLGWLAAGLWGVNVALLVLRLLLLAASRHSFAERGPFYWLSPLADLPAVLRVVATTLERPREWRGGVRPAVGISDIRSAT